MSWFGKLIGGTIGLVIGGGPLGLIAGAAIGHHLFDKKQTGSGSRERVSDTYSARRRSGASGGGQWQQRTTGERPSPVEERQAAFFLALFSILGKLAKADGRVSREEGQAVVSFLDRMKVSGSERQFAIRVFNEAKNSRFTVEELARQYVQIAAGQHDLHASLVDMLFQIALADNEFHPAEEAMIRTVASILSIPSHELDAIRARYVADTKQAYAVLGLSAEASDDEVKSTYRRLVQEYHPDRIVSQGMPEEFVEYATTRFQEIQAAWDAIRRERGLT